MPRCNLKSSGLVSGWYDTFERSSGRYSEVIKTLLQRRQNYGQITISRTTWRYHAPLKRVLAVLKWNIRITLMLKIWEVFVLNFCLLIDFENISHVRFTFTNFYNKFLTNLFLRRISTRRNDQRFRREIATKLFRRETIFDFHMNNFDTIIENIIKNKVTFKNVKSNWE